MKLCHCACVRLAGETVRLRAAFCNRHFCIDSDTAGHSATRTVSVYKMLLRCNLEKQLTDISVCNVECAWSDLIRSIATLNCVHVLVEY